VCGLTGFLAQDNHAFGEIENNIKIMTNALCHRGPDDQGIWIDETSKIALGHTRLSILDLSPLGHQPMFSHNNRFVIVFNGEIYNFFEIRRNLEQDGYKFKGGSDTEVILSAIDRYGLEKAINNFIGMFAFAVFDAKDKILCLARDRMGIKPLYYGWTADGAFIFGSELKSLMAYPGFARNIDLDSLSLFFRHNYIPAPFTIFKDAFKLLPGNYLILDKNALNKKTTEIKSYWSAKQLWEQGQENIFNGTEEDAINVLDDLLTDSVRLRLISDVPVGAFLSGGIDSTAVVAIMQKINSCPVKTFSMGFYDKEYNEANHASIIAKKLGTDHTEHYVTPKESMDVIAEIPRIWDEPFADSSQIPTFLLSRLTRQHVTVALSGDGGDEVFGGYSRYLIAPDLWKKISLFPFFVRKPASLIMKNLSGNYLNFLGFFAGKFGKRICFSSMMKRLAEISNIREFTEFYGMLYSHFLPFGELVRGKDNIAPIFREISGKKREFLDVMSLCDLLTYLPDDILTKVDRASMANALEARVPILDHRIVKFSMSLPASLKIRNSQSKWLLRQVLYRHIPRELMERPKMGFGVPIGKWLRTDLADWAKSLINEAGADMKEYLHWDKILKIWHEHKTGKANHQYVLWNILVFLAWHEKWKK
jgi:asparagine synthase (glutamine-hydrolysing)